MEQEPSQFDHSQSYENDATQAEAADSMTPVPGSGVVLRNQHSQEIAEEGMEDPQTAAQIDTFLAQINSLSKAEKTAKVQELKAQNPKLFAAVQVRVKSEGKKRMATVREGIDKVRATGESATQVDKELVALQTEESKKVTKVLEQFKKSA